MTKLHSMTGFAQSQGHMGAHDWVWELRSVNGKGLDIRLRLPPGFEALEQQVRKSTQDALKRGNVQISLKVSQAGDNLTAIVNNAAIDAILEAAKKLDGRVGGGLPTAAEILSIRGIVEFREAQLSEVELAALNSALMSDFETALCNLAKARADEGRAISAFLTEQVEAIDEIRAKIDADPSRTSDAIAARLDEQVDRLLSDRNDMDTQRLHQEVAILAAKADIQEELDRLKVHIIAARDLLDGQPPVGRKLDFLSQEFNRECNTICSKSNSATVSTLGLEMKLVIDRFREQIQNME